MTIKAIETIYPWPDGYRFRSRLEARWAVFFDALHEPYRYEIEGIKGDGLAYLPDFWLPRWQCFVEVKGELDIQGGRKIIMIGNQTDTDHLLVKNIGDLIWSVGPKGPRPKKWAECPFCHCLSIVDDCDCDGCRADRFKYLDCPVCSQDKGIKIKKDKLDLTATPKILQAYAAARQARFEHGETPRVFRGKPK